MIQFGVLEAILDSLKDRDASGLDKGRCYAIEMILIIVDCTKDGVAGGLLAILVLDALLDTLLQPYPGLTLLAVAELDVERVHESALQLDLL